MQPRRQIIAIGGGFARDPENLALERYVLAQARARNPSVCFVPTASGEDPSYIRKFHRSFATLRCRPTHLRFFERTPDVRALILAQDVVYVGGGNTKSMLAVWHEWGLSGILREAWRHGIVLAGVSAGAICWFETGITDSWAGRLAPLPCLGLIRGTCCPHYDGEAERKPAVHTLVAEGVVPTVLAIDDGAAVHFVGDRLVRVVSSRPGAAAHRVRRKADRAVELRLPVVRLARTRRRPV